MFQWAMTKKKEELIQKNFIQKKSLQISSDFSQIWI